MGDCFNTTISPKAFNSLRINLRDSMRNDAMNVARYQAWHHFLHAVGDRKVSLEDQIAFLNGVTQKKYEGFADYLSTNVQTLFFVYGNADEKFVKDIGDSLNENIESNYVEAINDTHTSHRRIPKGLSVAQFTNKNSHDDNDSITILWQIAVGDSNREYYKTMTMMEILTNILKEAAFDELRTRQNLGYTCSTRPENFGFIAYLRLDVEGPDHDASQMLDVIVKFVDDFWETVKDIDDKKWEKMLRTQRSRYRKREKTLQETHDSLWMGLKTGSSSNDEDEKMSDMANRVLLSGFKDFYSDNIMDNRYRRALAIQVFRKGRKHSVPKTKHTLLDKDKLLNEQGWVDTMYADVEASVAEQRVGHRPHSPFFHVFDRLKAVGSVFLPHHRTFCFKHFIFFSRDIKAFGIECIFSNIHHI